MTVSPLIPLAPAMPGTSPSAPGGAEGAAASPFSALVAQLLAGQHPVAPAGPGTPEEATEVAEGEPADGRVDEGGIPQAFGAASAVPVLPGITPGLPTVAAAPAAATGATTGSGQPMVVAAPPRAAAGAVAAGSPATPESARLQPSAGPGGRSATPPAPEPGARLEATAATPTTPAAPAATTTSVTDPATGPATAPSPSPSPSPSLGAVGQAAPVGGPPATEAPTATVSRQVFPEVTRLVTAGNGTHRVTLQLNPEALGEVRVVLSVRDGEVHVRLAAGSEAQRALAEGAPELHRLLELAGASDTKIVVRDLIGPAPGTAALSGPVGQGGDGHARPGSGEPGPGAERSPDQHAGTRGGRTARDGTHDGASPPRLVEQVTDARTSGVDVTV